MKTITKMALLFVLSSQIGSAQESDLDVTLKLYKAMQSQLKISDKTFSDGTENFVVMLPLGFDLAADTSVYDKPNANPLPCAKLMNGLLDRLLEPTWIYTEKTTKLGSTVGDMVQVILRSKPVESEISEENAKEIAALRAKLYIKKTEASGEITETNTPEYSKWITNNYAIRRIIAKLEYETDPAKIEDLNDKRTLLELDNIAVKYVHNGVPYTIEDIESKIEQLRGGGFKAVWERAKEYFNIKDFNVKPTPGSPNLRVISFLPDAADWRKESGWVYVETDSNKLKTSKKTTTSTQFKSGSAGWFWTASYKEGETKKDNVIKAKTELQKAKYGLKRVMVYRPWLKEEIFLADDQWSLLPADEALLPEGISNGGTVQSDAKPPLKGHMALIITDIILAKDVEFEGTVEKSVKTAVEENKNKSGSLGVSFAGFGASGNYSATNGLTFTSLDSERDIFKIKMPDVRIIGFVCKSIPSCHPR